MSGYVYAGIAGFLAGIVVNYFSDVLPQERGLTRPICANCSVPFSWMEYFFLKKCYGCRQNRNFRAYLILISSIIFSILIWLFPPVRLGYWLGLLVLAYFGLVIVIDMENHLIFHIVNLAGALIGLIVGTIRYNLLTALFGGIAGFLIMLLLFGFGILFSRYRVRKLGFDDGEESLGFGDVFLAGVLGFMLGWPLIIYGLTIGIFFGGFNSLALIAYLLARHHYEKMNLFTAYGPYLVIGAAILIYFPQSLTFLSSL